jgi:hypothetical protein
MKKLALQMFLIPVLAAQTSFSPCDINHDGVINIVDLQLVINQVLGLAACTISLNQPGVCNAVDVQIEVNAVLAGTCSTGAAPSIAMAPATGSTISGTTVLSVNASNAPATAAVAFDLGSWRLGVVTAPPFQLSWNTGFAADGFYSLQATAYDSSGAVLAQATTAVHVNNHGGGLTVNSPDLTKAMTGQVQMSLTGQDPSVYYPARWDVFLDGEFQFYYWTDNWGQNPATITPTINTTLVPNGTHELHIEVGSDYWPAGQQNTKTWYDHRFALTYIVTINNGHTLLGVEPGYEHVYLQPNQTLALTCAQTFTDNTAGPCGAPSYSSSDTSIVTVDTAGLLTAGSNEGFATVTLTEAGKSAAVYVWVMNSPTIPHFAGNGQMLLTYQPGASMFTIAPFNWQPNTLMGNASANTETKRAAVNALYSGFYQNPRSTTFDYGLWQSNYDNSLAQEWAWTAANGYHIYAIGDDAVRNPGSDAWWTLNWPYGQQAIQYAVESLAGSGVAIAMDMIDEGSSFWGVTPTPDGKVGDSGSFTSITCSGTTCTAAWPNNPGNTSFALDGSLNSGLNTPLGHMFTATNITSTSFNFAPASPLTGTFTAANDPNLEFLWWAGSYSGCPTSPCNPPIPNTALSKVAGWIRSASPTVPISWPALGVAPASVHDAWAGKDSKVSDFMSHYWDSLQAGTTYTWGSGVSERSTWMRTIFYQRQPNVRFDRPQMMLTSIASYMYTKETPDAAYYTPPLDAAYLPGTTPAATSADMMTAAGLGNAGLRLYAAEDPSDAASRASASLGSGFQTGANPFSGDQKAVQIWKSMGYAANLLTKPFARFFLSTPLTSPWVGANVVTAARQGPDGRLLMAVNATDWPQTVTISLGPYRTGNSIARYVAGSTEIRTALIADATSDTVALGVGESVVYLFPFSAATSYLTPVSVPAPTLPSGATAAFVHVGYIYSQDLGNQTSGILCTSGCTLELDRTVGDVFYQYFFVDSNGVLLGTSPVTTIPGD